MQASLSDEGSALADFAPLSSLAAEPTRALVWSRGAWLSSHEFLARAQQLAEALATRKIGATLNLCEDRGNFLLAFAAALFKRAVTLLPPSRAPQVLAELQAAHAHCVTIEDGDVAALVAKAPVEIAMPRIDAPPAQPFMIGYTSGSTGVSKGFAKYWQSVATSTLYNAEAIRAALRLSGNQTPSIVATVPAQHMYGMELSVLLPLLGNMAVHHGRPLFPADVAAALHAVPAPRILVTTPVHLRALVDSNIELPPLAGAISATAPLDRELAARIEQQFATVMFEMFGSTETCIFATRKTAHEESWLLYPGVELTPRPDGTLVMAPWFNEPMVLQDIVELTAERRFIVRGRHSDFVDVAGKRASLADLTRRLQAVEGVTDAVVFPPDSTTQGRVPRVAAIAVAPGLDAATVLQRLSASIDPAFLPRPLVLVDALPRNDTGKLPREALLKLLRR